MANTNKKNSLSDEEIRQQIKELSEKAKETSSRQLDLLNDEDFGDNDIDSGFDATLLSGMANPDESHRLYYGIRRLLIDNLPKGKENKKLRQFIYDEKNLFLNRGIELKDDGRRGSDGRQTYITPFLTTAFSAVADWIKTGANPYDIYTAFHDLNAQLGYHQKDENNQKE